MDNLIIIEIIEKKYFLGYLNENNILLTYKL